MRHYIRAAAIVLILGTPLGLAAQASDSLPFRAGQWGAEFSASQSFGSAGLLRFRSKQSAWMLDAIANIGSDTRSSHLGGNDFAYVAVRGGPRWYRSAGPRLLQFLSVGPAITYTRLKSATPILSSGQNENLDQFTTAGIFGELGAGWMVTPQLSLGASWGASVGYGHRTVENTLIQGKTHDTTTRWMAELGRVALRVNLYF